MPRTEVSGSQIKDSSVALSAADSPTGVADVAGVLPVANGGTGATTLTGLVKGNGASAMTAAVAGTDYSTPNGIETLTNKSLTNPRIGVIHDNNGATGAWIGGTASAVNFLQMGNAATGGRPLLRAQGETNVGLGIVPKGTGTAVLMDSNFAFVLEAAGVASAVNYILAGNSVTGNAPYVQGWGSDANIGLNLRTRGTGTVQANGADLVTTTGAQSLSSKTLTNPTITNYTESFNDIGTVGSANTIALTTGTVQHAVLTASTATTFTMPAVGAGKSFTLMLKQPSGGVGTATFTAVRWGSGGVAPTITATAGRMDMLTFFSDGTRWYGLIAQNFTY